MKNNQKICLKEFLPDKIMRQKHNDIKYNLNFSDKDNGLFLSYVIGLYNQTGLVGIKCYNLSLPKYITKNQNTFEVFGLLQAEMGKTNNGNIAFANHEYELINPVMFWFEKEFSINPKSWRWYIKLNINEPADSDYKKEIEEKVISHWLSRTKVNLKKIYPKRVSYIKNTTNKRLKEIDYGTLIIERGSNLFSQIIKNLVRKIFNNILNYKESEIRAFMKGIIAGESNVEIHKKDKRYRVHISADKEDEKLIYHNCLKKLDIPSKIYKYDKLIISKKENHIKLFNQGLMNLSPEKSKRFLEMTNLYQDFSLKP